MLDVHGTLLRASVFNISTLYVTSIKFVSLMNLFLTTCFMFHRLIMHHKNTHHELFSVGLAMLAIFIAKYRVAMLHNIENIAKFFSCLWLWVILFIIASIILLIMLLFTKNIVSNIVSQQHKNRWDCSDVNKVFWTLYRVIWF